MIFKSLLSVLVMTQLSFATGISLSYPTSTNGFSGQIIQSSTGVITVNNPNFYYESRFFPVSGDGDFKSTGTGLCTLLGKRVYTFPSLVKPGIISSLVINSIGALVGVSSSTTYTISSLACY